MVTNSSVDAESPASPEPRPTLEVFSDGPDRTKAIASVLAEMLKVGDLLVLTGDLGAGKTCFTQGLGKGLGIEQRITSPTFTLANQYRGRLLLHHLDVYRLDSVAETLDLDLPDLLESGVTVIEWGEQISEVLPSNHLLVSLRYPDLTDDEAEDSSDDSGFDDRIIEFVATDDGWQTRIAHLAEQLMAGTDR